MALEVRRQEKESSQKLIRRFTKSLQESGLLIRARKIRFKEREKSEQLKKRAALRREELKRKYQKLEKWGKLEL
jgi:hypothetical protein